MNDQRTPRVKAVGSDRGATHGFAKWKRSLGSGFSLTKKRACFGPKRSQTGRFWSKLPQNGAKLSQNGPKRPLFLACYRGWTAADPIHGLSGTFFLSPHFHAGLGRICARRSDPFEKRQDPLPDPPPRAPGRRFEGGERGARRRITPWARLWDCSSLRAAAARASPDTPRHAAWLRRPVE